MRILQLYKIPWYRSLLIAMMLLCRQQGFGQVDLKNSLNDLKASFLSSPDTKKRINLAVNIGSFFLTNKENFELVADSAAKYAAFAENLNNDLKDKGLGDQITLLKAKIFLRKDQLTPVNDQIRQASGPLLCQLHALAGNFYLQKPGEEKSDLDLAEKHFISAQNYAHDRGMPNIELINLVYRYNVMLERHTDGKTCDAFLKQILDLCKAYHSRSVEVKALQAKGINDLYNYNLVGNMYKAANAARSAKDTPSEAYCLKEIADYYLRQGNIDSADIQLKHVLNIYRSIGYKNLQFTYDLLVGVEMIRGNLDQAMKYSLVLVKTAEDTGTDISLHGFYARLAMLCGELGLPRQSAMWYKKWVDFAATAKTFFPYQAYSAIAYEMIAAGKTRQVLQKLDSAQTNFRHDPNVIFYIMMIRSDCYDALHKLDSAEYFNQQLVKSVKTRGIKDYFFFTTYKRMVSFYVKHKEYTKATPYLESIFDAGSLSINAADLAELYLCQFKVDSARGNYLTAIEHFQRSKKISDSLYNSIKLKQTQRLQIQYATAERDRENLVLRSRNNLQKSELEKSTLHRRLITIALVAFIMISGLMIYFYRLKQRTNKLLQKNQEEIHTQNEQLKATQEEINTQNEQLKSTQDEITIRNGQLNQLVHEKEWLIKEIHHRVKNNLQIISSLLNTQASYLDNEQAVAAIRDSQNRMQAISIVHHRLYQSEDLTTISIRTYIKELSESILDSFHSSKRIKFELDLVDALLDTAQTVPLGLILNEAITNSVKYAFEDQDSGMISLSSSIAEDNFYELVIRDNGRGLPAGFDIDACNSLGVNMIIGLTDQLGGRLSFATNGGTVITIAFPV